MSTAHVLAMILLLAGMALMAVLAVAPVVLESEAERVDAPPTPHADVVPKPRVEVAPPLRAA